MVDRMASELTGELLTEQELRNVDPKLVVGGVLNQFF